jgi:hypothetical protein
LTKGMSLLSCSYPLKLILILPIKQMAYQLGLYWQCWHLVWPFCCE